MRVDGQVAALTGVLAGVVVGLGGVPVGDEQAGLVPVVLDPVGAVRVVEARLAFDRPHPEDPTLYPSDHLGISALLEIDAA